MRHVNNNPLIYITSFGFLFIDWIFNTFQPVLLRTNWRVDPLTKSHFWFIPLEVFLQTFLIQNHFFSNFYETHNCQNVCFKCLFYENSRVVSDRLLNGRKEKQDPDIIRPEKSPPHVPKGHDLSTEKFGTSFHFFTFRLTKVKFEKSGKHKFAPKSITSHVLPTREAIFAFGTNCRNIVSRHIKPAKVISVFNNFSASTRHVRWVCVAKDALLRF